MRTRHRRAAPLSVLALLPLLLLGASSCGHLSGLMAGQPKPEVTVRDVALQEANLRRISLRVGFDVKNPYSVSLPVVGLRYRIWLSGVRLAEGSVRVDRPIPARGSAPLHTDVSFGPLDAARAAMRIAGGNRSYRIDGTMTVRTPMGEIGVRVSHRGTLSGSKAPGNLGTRLGLGRLL